MSRIRITFAESAVQNLEELQDWYAEQDVPEVGQRFVTEVLEKVAGLSDFPERGRVVPEFAQPAIRELIHPPFRVVYRRESSRIRVIRVWRSERLLKLPGDRM